MTTTDPAGHSGTPAQTAPTRSGPVVDDETARTQPEGAHEVGQPTEVQIKSAVTRAIGYDLVPVSIDGHPEIRYTYRTVEDRDRLVRDITAAVRDVIGLAAMA